MKIFIFNSYTNSFEIKENGHGKEYQRGVLSLDIDPNNDQILEIRTTQARQILYKIDLSVDSVDVNGTTTFANADELRDTIRPFFYRSTGGGGDQPLIPSQNAVDNFSLLPPPGDHTDQIWYVRNQTGTWIGSLVGVTRKQSGLYKSNGVSWEPTNDPLQYWVEGQISFKDNDGTGELLFNLDLTGSRTATFPDKNGTVAYLDDVVEDRFISFAQDSTQTVTFSTTGTVYLNLAENSLDNAATYKISGFYIWSHSEGNTDFFMEVRNFGSLLPPARHQQEPKDKEPDQRHYTSFSWTVTPTAGSISIDLNFGTTDSEDSSTLYGAYLQLDKIT